MPAVVSNTILGKYSVKVTCLCHIKRKMFSAHVSRNWVPNILLSRKDFYAFFYAWEKIHVKALFVTVDTFKRELSESL